MIETVIFDIGNVLVDFCWEKHFKSKGLTGQKLEALADATVRSQTWYLFDQGIYTDEEILEENNYKFNNLSEAIEYIKELELELANYQQAQGTDGEMITELRQEIERLKVFEANQAAFEQEKEQYYNEVVLGNGDQVASDFARWYENIDSATAEEIYRQVIEKEKLDQKLQDYVLAFSKMDAETAALIFQEMTGDLDTVIKILNTMDAKNRSAILSALAARDAVYAAKITQLLAP